MIQVYKPNNSDFTHNGDAVIFPEYAEFTSELNGVWSGNITVPVAEGSGYELVTEEAVIKMPAYNGEQLYRALNVYKDTSAVTADLQPIFFDSAKDCFITDARPTSKTGQQALTQLCAINPKYSGVSDITGTSTAYYEYVNLMEAICGDEDNAFIHRWGGEIEYDNFTVRVMQHLGSDKGEEFRYGKQIESIEQVVDDTEVVTRIYPKAYNGVRMSNAGYVDSPVIGAYPIVKTGTISFGHIKLAKDATDEDRSDPEIIICNTQAQIDAALQTACMEQFDLGLDKPKVTITIDSLADLRKIQGFEQFGTDIALGDTVKMVHEVLGIESTARIVSLTYDAVGERVTRLTIGTPAENYIDALSSTINKVEKAIRSDGSVKADKISGVIDLIKTNLYKQYNAAELSDVPAILFENNDTNDPMYGAMAIGTQGFQIAKTKDSGGNWVWKTWGTANGLIADYIAAGKLSSMDTLSYWDLTNSIFRFYDQQRDSYIEMDKGYLAFGYSGSEYGRLSRWISATSQQSVLGLTVLNSNSVMTVGADEVVMQASAASGSSAIVRAVNNSANKYVSIHPDNSNNLHYIRVDGKSGLSSMYVNDSYLKINDNATYQQIQLYSGANEYLYIDGKNKQANLYVEDSYFNISDNTNYQYIMLKSGADTWIRIDNKVGRIFLYSNELVVNNTPAYTGTWTVSGKTLTIKNGIITGAT